MKIRKIIPSPLRGILARMFVTIRTPILKYFFRDYSQNGETIFIRKLAKEFSERTFVEIGANDGVTISTTYGLLLDKWQGWSVEANPVIYASLEKNLKDFRLVKTFCLAAAPKRGKVRLYLGKDDPNGFYSTISTDKSVWFDKHRSDSFVDVEGIPLSDFLTEQAVPKRFGLLLIDTEGMDLEVLQTLDFCAFRPRLIVTEEYAEKSEVKHALLKKAGYRFRKKIGANTVWCDMYFEKGEDFTHRGDSTQIE